MNQALLQNFLLIQSDLKLLNERIIAMDKLITNIETSIREDITDIETSIRKDITDIEVSTRKDIINIETNIKSLNENNETIYQKNYAQIIELKGMYDELCNSTNKLHDTANEVLWANIFNNTIKGSSWLGEKMLSPGRWAAGYPFLYILYRVLNDTKPRYILELGLGETTKLISQYVATDKDIEHYVVEHDPVWIDFFKNSFDLSTNTDIVQLSWTYQSYKNIESVRAYEGFAERFANKKYDFICIDGPLGGDMKEYARIDVLSLIPENITDTFVIIVDDYNRCTEQNTVTDILLKLENSNIKYRKGVYKGSKDVCIICSEDISFLCSL